MTFRWLFYWGMAMERLSSCSFRINTMNNSLLDWIVSVRNAIKFLDGARLLPWWLLSWKYDKNIKDFLHPPPNLITLTLPIRVPILQIPLLPLLFIIICMYECIVARENNGKWLLRFGWGKGEDNAWRGGTEILLWRVRIITKFSLVSRSYYYLQGLPTL